MQLSKDSLYWTTGVGKSGIAAQYLADLLASAGIPAGYVHATEALHGSLGRIRENDTVIGFSASGTTSETLQVLRESQYRGAQVMLIAGVEHARSSEGMHTVLLGVGPEDETIGRLPTASFQAQIAWSIEFVRSLIAVHKIDVNEAQRAAHPGGYLGGSG